MSKSIDHCVRGLAAEIIAERERQLAKFPDCETLPDGTGGGGRETYMTIAQHACDRAYREKVLTHAHVFEGVNRTGVNPDLGGVYSGVTTIDGRPKGASVMPTLENPSLDRRK